LEVKENLAGQQEMFDQQDDDDEMPDAGDSTSDDDSVEVIDPDDLEEEEEKSGDDSESHDESDEEDAEEIAAFDAKLAAALGSHLADPNRDDDSSDSDADMNDDEMEAVDEMLVKVFKARSQAVSKKQDKKDAKETMINFKNRVLDLLEIYVKRCHSDILALDLIMALLRLTRQSTSQISLKAKNLLHKYFMLCKGTAIPALDGEDAANQVWDLLRAVHQFPVHRRTPPRLARPASCS
jgi:DNA polymerase phi